MQIHYLSEQNSLLTHYLSEIRDVTIQTDRLRFRKNMERIGEIMAYEISKSLVYEAVSVQTPLGTKHTAQLKHEVVLCSILRAGLSLHQGFMNFYDRAENGFVSAYRHHPNQDDYFEIKVEYQAVPSFTNKTVLLLDPMLATGQSIEAVIQKLHQENQAHEVHIAVVIAAPEGIAHLQKTIPANCHVWVASLDERLNEKNYIIPGLGDAGDLAYGPKL